MLKIIILKLFFISYNHIPSDFTMNLDNLIVVKLYVICFDYRALLLDIFYYFSV